MWKAGYGKLTTLALAAGFILVTVAFAINRQRWRDNIFGALSCAGTAVLALVMIRNYPLFALVMIPATAKALDEAGVALRWARWPMMGIFAALGILVVSGRFFQLARMDREFGLIVPEGHQRPVDHFRQAGIKGPIFNNFDIGSFLIWKLPEERVFVDGRPEAYPSAFFRDVYVPMQHDPLVWARESERYKLNAIVWNTSDATPWSQAFIERITNDPDWTLMFFGDGVLILLRNTEANMPIIMNHPPRIIPR
jgi:hypothetical protein